MFRNRRTPKRRVPGTRKKYFGTFRTRYAKKKKQFRTPQAGGFGFWARGGLARIRVPGTRFFFVRGGVRDFFFSRTPKMLVKS